MKKVIPITSNKRSCSGCTLCCEGWLAADINGQKLYPGKKCHFVDDAGCSIYLSKDRPKDPCDTYKCAWLEDESIPLWMKPSKSKVILSKKRTTANNIEYLAAIEAGQVIESTTLNWLILYALNNQLNIHYQVSGGWNWLGSKEFTQDLRAEL